MAFSIAPMLTEAAQVLRQQRRLAIFLAQRDFILNQPESRIGVGPQMRILFKVSLDIDRLAALPTGSLIGQ